MTDKLSLLGLSGSLRAGSLNTSILLELGRLAGDAASLSLADYRQLPHFDSDLTVNEHVEALREQVRQADGVLIASPEYNYSVPGPLKNALDWLSRPAYSSVFRDKPVAIVTASPGPIGGARAQSHLKVILSGMVANVFPYPEIAIGSAGERVKDGRLVPESEAFLAKFVADYTAWVRRQRRLDQPENAAASGF